jgi:hypothetical protein
LGKQQTGRQQDRNPGYVFDHCHSEGEPFYRLFAPEGRTFSDAICAPTQILLVEFLVAYPSDPHA